MPIKRAAKAAPEQDPAVTRALADLAETLGVGPIATLDRTKRLTELVTLDRELTPEEDAELAAEAKRRADRRRAAREGEKRRAKWIRKHGPLVTVDDNLAYHLSTQGRQESPGPRGGQADALRDPAPRWSSARDSHQGRFAGAS